MTGGDGGANEASGTKVLVEGALCVALSVVLSHVKFFRMPQGGSITLEMAPLLYFSYNRGFKKGFLAGGISGVLQILTGGYIVHPVQALLDYPLAFAAMGVAGFFKGLKWDFALGAALASGLRLACHVLSGAVFFSHYAPAMQNPWVYSLVYNATFIAPQAAISAVSAWTLAG